MIPVKPPDPPRSGAIPRRSPEAREQDPVDFLALRMRAIALTQAASGDTWTDYNLHDPGVTILEAVCYAMTELGYRADFPVADQLTGPNQRIDFKRQALFAPEEILPCRPTCADDYRRLLLDRIPDLADARFTAPARRALPGLHHLRLRLADPSGGDERGVARAALEAARGLLRAHRGLAEDFDHAIHEIAPTFCELELDVEIQGVRDPVDILADIYLKSAATVAGLVKPKTFEELLREGCELEEIFDGPAWEKGVVARADPERALGRLSVADLRTDILGIDGVADVSRLILHMDGKTAGPVLTWDPALTALRLRMPGAGEQQAKPGQVKPSRRGVPLSVDYGSLSRRCADRVRPGVQKRTAPLSAALPPPEGVYRQPPTFHSVRDHFPTLYGLRTESDTAPGVPPYERLAEPLRDDPAGQMKAYLALFDQMLANGAFQLDHLRDLFTTDVATRDGPRPSYWRGLLTDAEVPGVERLYIAPPEAAADRKNKDRSPRELLEPWVNRNFDDAAGRRSEALDFLLSLYGETLAQNTTRQFLDHLDSSELASALLDNKAEYLRQMVSVGRDRAAGFDYGGDLWADPELTTGLQRRIGLLVGFARWDAHELIGTLGEWRPEGEPPARITADATIRPLAWLPPEDAAALRARPLAMPPAEVHGVLFANGLHRNRYGWQSRGVGQAGILLLRAGPAENEPGASETAGSWWPLRRFSSEASAARYAAQLRDELKRRTDDCEGLHIIEHILLRPRDGRASATAGFHGLRATLVLPKWTSRTSQEGFRAFVEETLQINCPAHVCAGCLWLDLPAMARFERLYADWLRRLRLYAGEGSGDLDTASARLARFLRDQGVGEEA